MKTPVLTNVIAAGLCIVAGYGLGKMGSKEVRENDRGSGPSRLPASVIDAKFLPPPPPRGRDSLAGLTYDQVKQRTLAVLREPDLFLRWEGLYGVLAGMNEQNSAAVADAVYERYASGANTMREGEMIQFREGQVMKEAAMKDLPAEPNGKPSYPLMNKMKGWASADPQSARAWIETLEPGQVKSTLLRNWQEGLSQASPKIIESIFSSLPADQQRPLIGGLLTGLMDGGGFPAVQAWYETNTKTAEPAVVQAAFSSIMDRMAQSPQHWDEMFSFIKSQAETVDLGSIGFGVFFRRVAPTVPGKCLDLLSDLSQSSPAIAGQLDSMIGQTIEHSTSTSLNTLATWFQAHRDHPLYDRAVQQFARRTYADDPESALRWAETIKDDEVRTRTMAAMAAP